MRTREGQGARVEVGVRVEFPTAGDFIEAFHERGNETALFVSCDHPLEPGAELGLSVSFAGLQAALRCQAHVIWRRRVTESTDLEPAGMQLELLLDDAGRARFDEARASARAQLEAQERLSTTCRVLVVDDSPETRRLFMFSAQRLARQAHLPIELVEASDGVAALAALSEGKFHLAIVDYHMPIMDGRQLVERIRSDARLQTLPVVVVSHDPGVQSEAVQAGASLFLVKPVTSKKLLETLVTLLDVGRP